MKIGLIAMSGIRAASEELNRIGLTLPGVVERSRVIASMPSLSLLTLAALTPPEIEVEYHEIADLRAQPALPDGFDLVAIATFSAQSRDAYAVADHYRSRGVAVVMGGLHVTAEPDEAAAHCTSIAIGEGEPLWPRMIDDFCRGELAPRYGAPLHGSPDDSGTPPNHATVDSGARPRYFALAHAPVPRFDLLDFDKYNRIPVQTSRGCPHKCDFCASSIMLTPKYALKPVERVMAEIRAIKERWPAPFVEFADDNSFAARGHYKRLLAALRHENVKWFTEADISIADDPELLDLLRESGCRQVLIGLESPTPAGLRGVELRRDWKLRQFPRYEAAIHAIQSRGVTVNGCFILGLDGDTCETFDAIYDFIDRTNLFEAQITVLTPFPGTPLYERLRRAGRIIEDRAWHKCTLFDVNFVPRNMTPEALQTGLIELAKRIYAPEFVERRRRRFFENLWERRIAPGPGIPAEWRAAG